MSKSETKMSYADALAIAEHLVNRLKPGCERIIIAGSLRRQKREIGDIEVVAQPKLTPALDLFGEPVAGMEHSGLDERLASLGTEGYTKNGPKYKQFIFGGASVDLFIASQETWGCVATIRTGSADFTHWLVTPRNKGGGCFSHLKFQEGRLMDGGKALDTSEERLLFVALEQDWIEPVDRIDGRWRR
jgi:DNA polymerase/3'-5' exonuclease PolX